MKTMGSLRATLAFTLALTCAAGALRAQVAGYPDRPIKLLVGFGAGGGTDIVARILAPKMSNSLGQSVVVENRTGASGMIAAADVAKSPPDGYTLMMGTQTIFAVGPILYRKAVTLDPAKDFAGVTLTGASPLVLVANPAFPAHTVADVIAMAKANPGQINFGTGGVGTTPHMTAELFEHEAGIRMVHVPYRGEAPAINDGGRRTDTDDVCQPVGSHGPSQRRHPARDCRHQRAARAHRARPADGCGNYPGLCGRKLVRHRRAGRNAARYSGKAQRRRPQGARLDRHQGASRPARHEQQQF